MRQIWHDTSIGVKGNPAMFIPPPDFGSSLSGLAVCRSPNDRRAPALFCTPKIFLDQIPNMIYIPFHLIPMRGRFLGRLEVRDGEVAPAGAGWTSPRALGRPRVAVRAHYGALPSMAGRGQGKAGESLPERCPGSTAPEPEIATVERRKAFPLLVSDASGTMSRPLSKVAPFGAPPPSFGRRFAKTFTQSDLRAAHRRARRRDRALHPAQET